MGFCCCFFFRLLFFSLGVLIAVANALGMEIQIKSKYWSAGPRKNWFLEWERERKKTASRNIHCSKSCYWSEYDGFLIFNHFEIVYFFHLSMASTDFVSKFSQFHNEQCPSVLFDHSSKWITILLVVVGLVSSRLREIFPCFISIEHSKTSFSRRTQGMRTAEMNWRK